MKLDRRGFLLTSFAAGAASALPACDLLAPPQEPADGSFERPFTQEDPGPWADQLEVHQPVIYGSLIDSKRLRLWTEVRDVGRDVNHEMVTEHFVQRILLADEFLNVIDDRSFRFDGEARLVTAVEIPPEVTAVYAYHQCNLHGWWRASYSVQALKVAPVGDARRAYTAEQPGNFAGQAPTHVPRLGRLPDGSLAVDVGDRAAGALHPQQANHYVQQILIYDQYDQLRAIGNLRPEGEPSYTFDVIGGTSRLRVLAFCNTYDYWEAEFSVE